jgi:hypothetical protein
MKIYIYINCAIQDRESNAYRKKIINSVRDSEGSKIKHRGENKLLTVKGRPSTNRLC